MIKLRDNDNTAIAPKAVTVVQNTVWTKHYDRHDKADMPALLAIIDGQMVVLKYYKTEDRDADYAMLTGPVDAK